MPLLQWILFNRTMSHSNGRSVKYDIVLFCVTFIAFMDQRMIKAPDALVWIMSPLYWVCIECHLVGRVPNTCPIVYEPNNV